MTSNKFVQVRINLLDLSKVQYPWGSLTVKALMWCKSGNARLQASHMAATIHRQYGPKGLKRVV